MTRATMLFSASLSLLLVGARVVAAHERTTSYSSWRIAASEASVLLTVSEADVAALGRDGEGVALERWASQRLVLRSAGDVCPLAGRAHRLAGPPGRIRLAWTVAIAPGEPLEIHSELFTEVSSGHLHFATVQGERPVARVLTSGASSWSIGSADAGQTAPDASGWSYVVLGVEHIATGYDHLAFLLALLLGAGSLGTVVRVVTGFTIGHSVTLALSALNLVRPHREPIEALIGVSIALVGIENVWLRDRGDHVLPAAVIGSLSLLGLFSVMGFGRVSALCWSGLVIFSACYYPLLRGSGEPMRGRWMVALIFGLVHGFGFASVLQEADLPAKRLVAALLGFNVGVELGQVAIVTVAWPLLRLATGRCHAFVIDAGSTVALFLGVYWTVQRNYS